MRRQQSVSNQHLTLAHESPAAAVGRGLWPERERVQPWWSAHRRPSVAVRSLRASALVHEIEKQFPVGRKIAFFFVDARPDPCPVLEAIRAHVPPNQVTPRARATPQDDRDPGFARDDCEQPTRDETRHEKRGAAGSCRGQQARLSRIQVSTVREATADGIGRKNLRDLEPVGPHRGLHLRQRRSDLDHQPAMRIAADSEIRAKGRRRLE